MNWKLKVLLVVAVAAWLYFGRRSTASVGTGTPEAQPLPTPPPLTPIEQAQATLPPGTPIGMGGGQYVPPLSA